jgi:penicillin V acylase-like amidase (Ntn superfamily)
MCTNLMISVPTNPGQITPELAKTYVSARALEMPGVLEQSVYVVPSNQTWPLTVPLAPAVLQGLTTVPWPGGYGFVGIAPSGLAWQEAPSFNDGINSQGLSVGALWLAPGTEYAKPAANTKNQVSFLDFPAWILSSFALVEELVRAMASIVVVGPPPPTDTNPSQYYVPLHYVITDSTGQSVVIEFIKGLAVIHKSPNAVLTNWPTHDWQMTNVKDYFNLTPFSDATSTTGAGNPVGGGLLGLPGDALSASRFVKASILCQGINKYLPADGTGWLPAPGVLPSTPPSKNPPGFADSQQTAVTVALQLVQICMGTPYGMLLKRVTNSLAHTNITATTPPSFTATYGDYTMWSCVRDHTNLKYYFMSAFSGILTLIDLNGLNFTTTPSYPANATLAVLPQPGASWCLDVTSGLISSASV